MKPPLHLLDDEEGAPQAPSSESTQPLASMAARPTSTGSLEIVVTDARIDPSHRLLEGKDTSAVPKFTVSEAAKVFFGKSPHWMRWRERNAWFVVDGDPNCDHLHLGGGGQGSETHSRVVDGFCTKCGGREVGTTRTAAGARQYSLSDIEEMAHALAQRGAISGEQLKTALEIVAGIARLYGYLR